MSEQREMTLDEWVNRLPDFHLANKQYQQLQQRNAELAATVERLRSALIICHNAHDDFYIEQAEVIEAIESTPRQNLSAIKREAWIKGYQSTDGIYHGENTEYMSIVRLANQRYPDKD